MNLDLIDGVGELHQVPHPRDGVLDLGGAKLEPRLEGSGNLGAGDGSLVAVDLVGRLNGRDAVLKRCSDELERLRDGGAACERRAVSQCDAADRHWEGHMWLHNHGKEWACLIEGGWGGVDLVAVLDGESGEKATALARLPADLPHSLHAGGRASGSHAADCAGRMHGCDSGEGEESGTRRVKNSSERRAAWADRFDLNAWTLWGRMIPPTKPSESLSAS